MATKKTAKSKKSLKNPVIDKQAKQRALMAKRAALPIWYAYVAKDSNGNFFEGATDSLEDLKQKAAKSDPLLTVVWNSTIPSTFFAVSGYLNVVRKMSQENKAGYDGSAEEFLTTLTKIKIPLKKP
jgi:hypothetical protein